MKHVESLGTPSPRKTHNCHQATHRRPDPKRHRGSAPPPRHVLSQRWRNGASKAARFRLPCSTDARACAPYVSGTPPSSMGMPDGKKQRAGPRRRIRAGSLIGEWGQSGGAAGLGAEWLISPRRGRMICSRALALSRPPRYCTSNCLTAPCFMGLYAGIPWLPVWGETRELLPLHGCTFSSEIPRKGVGIGNVLGRKGRRLPTAQRSRRSSTP